MAQYTRKDLVQHLAAMGIGASDTLLVHSSVRSVGAVDDRADGILDALQAGVARGLLVLPTLTWDRVNAAHPRMSVTHTPSCVGALTEVFRQRAGVVRSWHPTHSVAACGDEARTFTAGHEQFDTPCARRSPWGRLVDRDAWVLFIGCGIGCNTLIHGVEEWCGVPGRLTDDREALEVETPDGRVIPVPSRRHIGNVSEHYGKLEPLLLERGIMSIVRFGDARSHLARVQPMAAFVEHLLSIDSDLFSHERMPGLHAG